MRQLLSVLLLVLAGAVLTNCAQRDTRETDQIQLDREKIQQTLSGEVSLAKDRSELAELRKEIPSDVQKKNDELALIAELMAQPKVEPSRIRQQFQYAAQKRHQSFSNKVRKLREDFTKEERKSRDAFLKAAKHQREEINPKKLERSEINERYRELDKERRDFFSEQRERRKNFEAELRAQTKDFNDSLRAKKREFSDQMRQYTLRYNQMKKDEKEKEKEKWQRKVDQSKSEFQKMDQVPSEPLTPGGQ